MPRDMKMPFPRSTASWRPSPSWTMSAFSGCRSSVISVHLGLDGEPFEVEVEPLAQRLGVELEVAAQVVDDAPRPASLVMREVRLEVGGAVVGHGQPGVLEHRRHRA